MAHDRRLKCLAESSATVPKAPPHSRQVSPSRMRRFLGSLFLLLPGRRGYLHSFRRMLTVLSVRFATARSGAEGASLLLCNRRATTPAGMHRRRNAQVVSPLALRACETLVGRSTFLNLSPRVRTPSTVPSPLAMALFLPPFPPIFRPRSLGRLVASGLLKVTAIGRHRPEAMRDQILKRDVHQAHPLWCRDQSGSMPCITQVQRQFGHSTSGPSLTWRRAAPTSATIARSDCR